MPETKNVSAAKPKTSGAVFRAPVGTTLPTDATTELNAAFKELGFVSDDGATNANSPETESVYAWGGTPVLDTVGERPDTWKLKFIETLNPEVQKLVYGDKNVTVTTDLIKVAAGATDLGEASFVIDTMLKGGALRRIVIPNGSLSELGDIVYKDDEPIGYEVTLSAKDDGTGHTHYEYTKLPAAS